MKLINFTFEQYYLPAKPVLSLAAACEISSDGLIVRACISEQCDKLNTLFSQANSVDKIAEELGIAVIDFSVPLRLHPVHIAKPWGREIWYTGIEARGVSQVVSETGMTPLPWVIALDKQRILGQHEQVNLLKILDPLPDEVFGDLYFELHEKKREVYIVTHVDKRAWPDGVGAIRYGFSRDKHAQFSSDTEFLQSYSHAVHDYHIVRRQLDGLMDALRERDGVGLQEPVDALQTRRWLAELPQDLQTSESTLRVQMDQYTAMRPLRIGDVLAVPLRTPHALQHGVRTVEFQTPVYERKILSFAQKVLTQTHWDTTDALQLVDLQLPNDTVFPVLIDQDGIKLEEIVRFEDFVVRRVYIAAGASFICEVTGDYQLVMTVLGRAVCGKAILEVEQACLLPASAGSVELQNPFRETVQVLIASPNN